MGKLFKNFKTRKQLKEEIARLQALANVAEMAYLQAKVETLGIKRVSATTAINYERPITIYQAQCEVIKGIADRLEPYVKWEEHYNPETLQTTIRGTVLLALKPRERGLDNGEE